MYHFALGNFWATVALVELMDLAFSIDNVFAAVAFSDNLILIWLGVFIGILAMRYVAQVFVKLMEKFPFLEACAFIVIGILGLKLSFSVYEHFYPEKEVSLFLASHEADWIISGITVGIFILPILYNILFAKKYPPANSKRVLKFMRARNLSFRFLFFFLWLFFQFKLDLL